MKKMRNKRLKVEVKPEAEESIQEQKGFGLDLNGSTSKIVAAAETLLAGGVSAGQLYASVHAALPDSARKRVPSRLEALLFKHGLHPDLPVGSTCYFLHRLDSNRPPACGPNAPANKVSLEQLLSMRPTPSLNTSTGGNALHLMVDKLLSRSYFPGQGLSLLGQSEGDKRRAEYLATAFPLMLQAGYSPTQPDTAGRTVIQMLRDAYTQYGRQVDQLRSSDEGDTADEGPLAMQVAIRGALEACGEEAPARTTKEMRFGKYIGRLFTELPGGYIGWMCRKPGFFDEGDPRKMVLLEDLMELGLVRREGEGEEEQGGGGGELVQGWPADVEQVRFTFGKHAGKRILDVGRDDPTYIGWMCRTPGFFDEDDPRKRALKRQLLKLGLVQRVGGGGEVLPTYLCFRLYLKYM
ncbi:hypothetical protein PLESTB_001730800 [Pleodorina starrii]|uniref:Exodeoxyribonuclease X-like C-terminal domain-containing protein n=1 Tax=Pleodorina starrii TaxID=330485 RepID=A0A9W6BZX6_9CHLO|nr:hypothetical protein PLESTM_000732900 [Pleodorina starrii]GLC61204.1 hypothetical protein PLESTB_001730800 [Pleodorina starrii]GLC75731.1 hypothetical protein PLESTF_001679300 [Pleodorina starrii]